MNNQFSRSQLLLGTDAMEKLKSARVAVFGIGIIFGALVSVKAIQKSLEKFRAQTVMLIIGMLIGSLYAIVMGPTTVSALNEMLNIHNFSVIFFIIGIILVVLLQLLKHSYNKKAAADI